MKCILQDKIDEEEFHLRRIVIFQQCSRDGPYEIAFRGRLSCWGREDVGRHRQDGVRQLAAHGAPVFALVDLQGLCSKMVMTLKQHNYNVVKIQ